MDDAHRSWSGRSGFCTAAILTADDKLLLQERDFDPDIEFPGRLSLFAGRSIGSETPLSTMVRELREELRCSSGEPVVFGRLQYLWCERRTDRPWIEHVFHVAVVTDLARIVATEGRGLRAVTRYEYGMLDRVAPHHAKYIERFWLS
jgi:8-oxo-dGTP pyrophosphatase MutT (NUDIX family)